MASRKRKHQATLEKILQGAVIQVHRVHRRRECGAALVARVRAFLEKAGEL